MPKAFRQIWNGPHLTFDDLPDKTHFIWQGNYYYKKNGKAYNNEGTGRNSVRIPPSAHVTIRTD
jgi:hypothetical protein